VNFSAVTPLLDGCLFVCMLSEIRDFVVADLKEQNPYIQFFLQTHEHCTRNAETRTLVFDDNILDTTQISGSFFLFKLAEISVCVCEHSVSLYT